jgi:hypothetical protein
MNFAASPSKSLVLILTRNVMGMVRFCSSNWDMAEVERDWKDVIVQKGGLLNKLYIPRL